MSLFLLVFCFKCYNFSEKNIKKLAVKICRISMWRFINEGYLTYLLDKVFLKITYVEIAKV